MFYPPLIPFLEDEMKPGLMKGEKSSFIRFLRDWQKKVALYGIQSPKIVSYSIGPLSGKISLILVPLLASEGLIVPQIAEIRRQERSSLIDYFNLFFGAKTALSPEEIGHQLSRVGAAVFFVPNAISSSLNGQIDWAGINKFPLSVENLNFITRSIMFLIFLSGANAVLFDIRIGGPSFLKDTREARDLARCLKTLCRRMNIRSTFFMINMNQPIGKVVGRSLEIRECLEILKGRGPLDMLKLVLEMATEMLIIGKSTSDRTEAKRCLRQNLTEGKALNKLKEIVEGQKGHFYPQAGQSSPTKREQGIEVLSNQEGYLQKIDMKRISSLCIDSKRQIRKICDSDTMSFEFSIFKKIGDRIIKGDLVAEVYVENQELLNRIDHEFQKIFKIGPRPPEFQPLIMGKWGEKDHF